MAELQIHMQDLHGEGLSELVALNRNITLLQSLSGELRQATSELLGSWLANISPAALKPIVAPLSHSIRPH